MKSAQAAAAGSEDSPRKLDQTDDSVSSTSSVYPISMAHLGLQSEHDLGVSTGSGNGMIALQADHNLEGGGQLLSQHKAPVKQEQSLRGNENPAAVFASNGAAVYGSFCAQGVWEGPTAQHQTAAAPHQRYRPAALSQQHDHQHLGLNYHHIFSDDDQKLGDLVKLPPIGSAFKERQGTLDGTVRDCYGISPTVNTDSATTAERSSLNVSCHYGNARPQFDCYLSGYSLGVPPYSCAQSTLSKIPVQPTGAFCLDGRGGKERRHNDGAMTNNKSLASNEVRIPRDISPTLLNVLGLSSARLDGLDPATSTDRDASFQNAGRGYVGENAPVEYSNGLSEARNKLFQENEELMFHIRSLTTQMEHMKKVAIKN